MECIFDTYIHIVWYFYSVHVELSDEKDSNQAIFTLFLYNTIFACNISLFVCIVSGAMVLSLVKIISSWLTGLKTLTCLKVESIFYSSEVNQMSTVPSFFNMYIFLTIDGNFSGSNHLKAITVCLTFVQWLNKKYVLVSCLFFKFHPHLRYQILYISWNRVYWMFF